MRINPTNSSPVQANDTASAKKSDKAGKAAAYEKGSESAAVSTKTEHASAEISSKAKDMAKAQQLATDAPDVRESKIAALREQIQNKKYNVSASDISDRLVDDHIRLAGA
jgi:flagellar biosynthesis anti-sigma factor FlgM